jgi:hypothetical protein
LGLDISELISEAADNKEEARNVVLLGLPSLSADMYERTYGERAAPVMPLGGGVIHHFAPAHDPFATASVQSEFVEQERMRRGTTNLYLSPLATKAQALGFTLFYLAECERSSASIVFPFSARYRSGSSGGVARVWLYRLEFPLS